MSGQVVAGADELSDGERMLVLVKGQEVGIFNIEGEYFAYTDWCPHQGGPCCEGSLDGTVDAEFDRDSLEYEFSWVKDDEVLRCPWHNWEFDIRTGECLHTKKRLISHDVEEEGDDIVVYV